MEYMTEITYTLGLDLGAARDPSACAIVEHKGDGREALHRVVYLHRWPLNTPYPTVARDVADLMARPPMPGQSLALDATGIGRAVVDMLATARLDCTVAPYVITAGINSGQRTVTKADLIAGLQAALGEGRLKVADLPLAPILLRELEGWRVEVSAAGTVRYDIARDGHGHGDLCVAVGLALHHFGKFRRLALPRFLSFRRAEGDPLGRSAVRPKYRPTRAIACPLDLLGRVVAEPDDVPLIVTVADPGEAPPDLDALAFAPAGRLDLQFADVDPREVSDDYHDPLPPWGATLDRLLMTKQEHGKRLWKFLLTDGGKRRDPRPTLFVFADAGHGDRRGLSLAYAICDALRLPRKQVFNVADPEAAHEGRPAPNWHVWGVAKQGRAMVIAPGG
jgi:hypothetical protein